MRMQRPRPPGPVENSRGASAILAAILQGPCGLRRHRRLRLGNDRFDGRSGVAVKFVWPPAGQPEQHATLRREGGV